jgi:hypothetical protein
VWMDAFVVSCADMIDGWIVRVCRVGFW